MEVKEVLKVRKYKAGYEVRTQLYDDSEYGGNGFTLKIAYTPSGDYIGDSKWGYRLCKKQGIKPELISPNHSVCSIGFSEKEQKWYGWSHRAMFGFGIGSQCKLGDCGYKASNKKEFLDKMRSWYDDEMYKNLKIEVIECGLKIHYEIHQNGTGKIFTTDDFKPYPDEWGRGEWTAKTLDDSKRMAIDFAAGVS